MQPEDDDYLTQEQYVLELPDGIAALVEDPDFEFDLVWDESGQSGRFVSNKYQGNLLFRAFRLPLVTESYTSPSGDVFFKNADVSTLILVYSPEHAPQFLKDAELLQQIQAYKTSRGAFPPASVAPHGLTPPTRWAPLQLYPQFPTRPKFSKPTPLEETSLEAREVKADQAGNAQREAKKKQLEELQKKKMQQLQEYKDHKRKLQADGTVPSHDLEKKQAQAEEELKKIVQDLNTLAQQQEAASATQQVAVSVIKQE